LPPPHQTWQLTITLFSLDISNKVAILKRGCMLPEYNEIKNLVSQIRKWFLEEATKRCIED